MAYTEVVQQVGILAAPRVDTSITTTASTTVTDAAVVATDVGKAVSGPFIPAGAYVVSASAGVSCVISAAATAGTGSVTFSPRIRAVASRTGFIRVYDPTLTGALYSATGGSAWQNAITAASSSLLSTNLPYLFNLATNSVAGDVSGPADYNDAAPWYSDPTAATPLYGTYRLHLVPNPISPDASSVQVLTVEPSALVIVAYG